MNKLKMYCDFCRAPSTAKAWLCNCWALHGFLPFGALEAVALKFVFCWPRWGCIHFFCLPFLCLFLLLCVLRPMGVTEAQASSGCSAGTQGSELQSVCPSALVLTVLCHPSLSLCHSLTVADSPTEGAALHLCWIRLLTLMNHLELIFII